MSSLKNLLRAVILIVLLINTVMANACTIFMANDGQNVWVGNNEDDPLGKKYRIWFYPAKKKQYGYAIWTDLAFKGLSYLNPQGGLNEHGLFMDYTFVDGLDIVKDPQRKDRKKQVVTDLLKKCKTVEEALTYLSQFNLIKIKYAQLFIGDASGNYATVTGGYVVRKTENSFALTNYCINNGYQEACHRRDVASNYLNSTKTFSLSDITGILEKSTQKLPNALISHYSMAINLKTKTIHLYYRNDFKTVSILSLAEQLKKGKHHKDVVDYFPKSITPVLEQELKSTGINAVIEKYTSLRKNSPSKFNFNNDDAINLSISWIDKGQYTNAIKLLECLHQFEPVNTNIDSWLGVAHRRVNNLEISNQYFLKVLAQKPDDYLATLWGKQINQKVTFKLADFEGAEQVSLMGDFTEWKKNAIKMKKENGYWTCEVTLPKGENVYKFIVNDQYLSDSKNYLHTGTGPDVFSKLYVW